MFLVPLDAGGPVRGPMAGGNGPAFRRQDQLEAAYQVIKHYPYLLQFLQS